jgi:hypothetical protein
MSRFLRRIVQLRVCQKGTELMEFALTAPVFLMAMFGVMEFGAINIVTVLMESGLREAARYGITGAAPDDGDRLAAIKQIIEEATVGLVDMDDADVDIRTYPTFGDVGQDEEFVDANDNKFYDVGETFTDANGNGTYDGAVAGAGTAGEVVVYRIAYDWPLMVPMLLPILGDGNGKFRIDATIAVRNEPWDGMGS